MDIPQIIPKASPDVGDMGQTYLAKGKHVAMRRWEESPSGFGDEHTRDYETVGYLVSGVLELDMCGERAQLAAGDSWLIPQGAAHRYRVVEPIVAIEATSPPARFAGRDQPV
ncbi:cupin domain-containing protein [Aporhodopirellula aestuarii]|uniref:Cupin domain-containing protein n=1 Tax=Aporhodopirellula aestuarii TaxID=2950107 RepID=A0ABT0TYM9_9BACT|nr:cupin domain-containing protein [Aporhodopirellula aestuarii]MCM2369681.1 cupin domain-containing protein [Aporhodopirellula aestuarii]